jgi:hypothetical protein
MQGHLLHQTLTLTYQNIAPTVHRPTLPVGQTVKIDMMDIKVTFTLVIVVLIAANTYLMAKLWYVDPSPDRQRESYTISSSNYPDVTSQDITIPIEKLEALITEYQQSNHQKLQLLQAQSLELDKKLLDLDKRIQILEEMKSMTDNSLMSLDDETEAQTNHHQFVTESELSHWVENSFISSFDPTATSLAMAEAEQSLAKFPGIYLNDMQCSDRFCRASLSHASGKRIPAEEMFGHPPFITDGFTMIEADGNVLFYFSQPGNSVVKLKEELLGQPEY